MISTFHGSEGSRPSSSNLTPLHGSWGTFLWDIAMDSSICCFQWLIITVSGLDSFPLPVTLLEEGLRSVTIGRLLF